MCTCWRIKNVATQWLHIDCANWQKVTFCDFCLTLDPWKSLRQHGPKFIFSEMQAVQQYWNKLNEVKTPWVLLGAWNGGHSMIACWLRQITKSNILWFLLDLWSLKILAPTWTQIYLSQKCKQQYWDGINYGFWAKISIFFFPAKRNERWS